MERVLLKDLKFDNRKDAVAFLKRLWRCEETPCPFCGATLTLLHKKAKKDDSDWQCKPCDKTFKAFYLLEEINNEMPR